MKRVLIALLAVVILLVLALGARFCRSTYPWSSPFISLATCPVAEPSYAR
jgi:hypothetical protein